MIIVSKKKLSEMNNNSTEKNIIQEAEGEKTFEVQYTVKFTDKVSAKSASEAQKKIRDKYKDQSVMITSTKEVEDDADDLMEDLAQDVAMDDTVDEISSDNRGFAGVINDLIIDEYDAINGYNGAIETAKVMGLETASKLLQDISDEETRHIGELQELMKTITPQAHEIENGGREAAEKLADFSEGVDDNVDGAIGANSPLWNQTSGIVLDNVDDDIMGIESYL